MKIEDYNAVQATKLATIKALPASKRLDAIAFDTDSLPESMKAYLRVEATRSDK